MNIDSLKNIFKEFIADPQKKKIAIIIIVVVIVIILLFTGLSVRKTYFTPPTQEEIEEQEREILDEKIRGERDELQRARDEVRGQDYVPPTQEQRDATITQQIQELEELRNR